MAIAILALVTSMALGACGRSSLRNLGFGVDGGGQAGRGTGSAGTGGGAGRVGSAGSIGTDGGVDGQAGSGGGGVGVAGRDGGVDGRQPVGIVVSPAVLTLPVGGQGAFSATLLYSDGTTADVTASAKWTSSDTQVGAVSAGRVISALRPGKTLVTAFVGTLSSSATLVVMASISLVGLNVDPGMAVLAIGTSAQLRATGFYSDGTSADLTPMAVWASTDAGVATVDVGRVTAWKAGFTTITATVGGFAGKAAVSVSPATVVAVSVVPPLATTGVGAAVRFFADATLSDGSHIDVTNAAVWVTDAAVASIDAGVAIARAAGKALVTATFGGRSGNATLVVTGAPLRALQIQPLDPVVGVGVTIDFSVIGIYSDGTRADLTNQVMWQSSSPGVLPLDGAGHAVSKSVGTSVVTATAGGGLVAASTVTVTPSALKSIAIVPPQLVLMPGGTAQLRAIGTYVDGTVVDITQSVTWNVMISNVATISNAAGSAGFVQAVGPGSSIVIAFLGGIAGNGTITVSPATLQSLAIEPAASTVPVGAAVGLVARGTFSDGTARDLTSQVAWQSTDDATATVTNAGAGVPGGVVTGVKAGTVTITAFLGGVGAKASVTVVAAPLKQIIVAPADATTTAGLRYQYTATALYSDGGKADVTAQATWTTGNANVATVTNVAGAEGQLVARAAGTTTVAATLDGVSGQTSVTVTGPTPVALSIQPIAISVPVGQAVQYTATLILSNGTTRNVTAQTQWGSSNPMAATINGIGRAVPVAQGTTTIGATTMGFVASTTLTVTAAVAVSVEVTPIAPTLPVGTIGQLTATAIFSDGTTRNVTNLATWLSTAPGVAAVNTVRNRGLVTAVSRGTAVVSATYMGLAGQTTVTVSDAVIVDVSVSPVGISMPVGTRRQFTAQAIRSDGTSMPITGLATWTSDAPMVAGVGTAGATRGQVTALSAGSANIRATYMGLTGSAPVTVTAATIVAVQVTPFNPTLSTGTVQPFVATALYSDGTSMAVTGMATWSSSDDAVAGVSNAGGSRGLVTTLMKGTTTISATYMGLAGATALSVTDATIVQIQVTPFDPTIPVGFTRQLTATAIYSDGTNRNITSLATWSSSDDGIAGVSNALATKGLVSTPAAGAATISAQYAGVTGTADVTVTKALVVKIDVAPATATAAVGEVVAFSALAIFDDGSTLDITTFVTWTSSDPDVADISNADGSRGEASAFGPGVTTIQAQRKAIVGSVSLIVK